MKTLLLLAMLGGAGICYTQLPSRGLSAPDARPIAVTEAKPAADAKPVLILGRVKQVLGDGMLVHDRNLDRMLVLQGHPSQSSLADGDNFQCYAADAGVYRYTTVLGSGATVHRFVYAAAPATPAPKPGDWMRTGSGTALDQKPRR